MLPLMLLMYTGRLGEAAAPLQPRIEGEIKNHLGYVEGAMGGRTYLLGDGFSGADVMMSFVLEVARAFQKLKDYPNLDAYLDRLHARPAWKAALDKGGAYALGR